MFGGKRHLLENGRLRQLLDPDRGVSAASALSDIIPKLTQPRLILSRGPVEGMELKMSPLFIDPGPRWPEVSIVSDKPSMRRAQGLAPPARAATLKNDKPGIAIEGPQGPTNRRRAGNGSRRA